MADHGDKIALTGGCKKGSPPLAAVGGTRSGVASCFTVFLEFDSPAAAGASPQLSPQASAGHHEVLLS